MNSIEGMRAAIERLLAAERPGTDFSDDAALYAQILEDYEDYARLLDDEGERLRQEAEIKARNAEIEAKMSQEVGDGVPRLFGASHRFADDSSSIFDIARGA